MKKISITILLGILMLTSGNLCFCQNKQQEKTVEMIMNHMLKKGNFSGTVLLASKGKVIYEKAFGYANQEHKIMNHVNTAFDVASTIKPLVATGVLKLCEEGKLSLEDELTSFFSGFPYYGVKIKHLLSHTSGLPDYPHHPGFSAYVDNKTKSDSNYNVSNKDVIAWLCSYKHLESEPGEKYKYCNANYVLLATIIEKTSGLSFYNFLREYILKPAKMNNSKLYDEIKSYSISDRAFGYEATLEGKYIPFVSHHIKGMQGDGGLYSTVRDLQKFLEAFLNGKLISKEMVDLALTPFSLNTGKKGLFGFGWIIREEGYENRSLTYKHGGKWEGFLTAFAYEPKTDNSIIILTNNSLNPPTIGELENALGYALSGKEPSLPRFPIQDTIARVIYTKGIEEAVRLFTDLKNNHFAEYFIDENEMNYLAMQLMWDNRKDDAIKILELNAREFPDIANNFDSIGNTYLELGYPDKAKEMYQKALIIDPGLESTKIKLEKLKK